MPARKPDPPTYTAEQVTQGQIVLRKRWQFWFFLGGLAVFVVLAVLGRILFEFW